MRVMTATLEMPAPPANTGRPKATKGKILLVDDDPAIRQVLFFRLLTEEDYLVVTAAESKWKRLNWPGRKNLIRCC